MRSTWLPTGRRQNRIKIPLVGYKQKNHNMITLHGTVSHGHRWCAGLMLAPLRSNAYQGEADETAPYKALSITADQPRARLDANTLGRKPMIKEWTHRHKLVRMAGFASAIAVGSLLPAVALAADIVLAVPNGSEGDGLRAAADDYQQMKGITIDIVQAPYANLFEKAANAGASKSGAYDIVLMDDPWLPFFVENGYLEPLGKYFQALGTDGPDSDFLGKSIALCRNPYNTGPYVCLPYVGNAQMFFYDPEEFAKQGQPEGPKTWDDVIKAAQAISTAGGGERFGYVMRAAEGNPVVADFMPIFWSYGGDLFDK